MIKHFMIPAEVLFFVFVVFLFFRCFPLSFFFFVCGGDSFYYLSHLAFFYLSLSFFLLYSLSKGERNFF